MTYQLIIRNGTIVDGLGGPPYVGDVAVRDGVIAAVGDVEGTGDREIDARLLRLVARRAEPFELVQPVLDKVLFRRMV